MAFKGHCQRDHDRIDFTDGATFEEHMMLVHRKRKIRPGGASHHTAGKAAPMGNGKPHPWKPAKPNGALTAWVESGDLEISAVQAEAAA